MRNVKRDLALPAKKRWRAPDGARRCLHRAVKIDIPRCHGPGGAPAKVCANKVSRGKGAAVQVNAPAAFLQKSRRKRCTACGGVVGLAGFEPTHAGVKVPCLTAWRQPSLFIEKSELFRVRFPCNVGWLVGLEPTASRATIWRASQLRHSHHIFGAPGGTRTPGPLLRRQLLYPPELRAPESSGLSEALLEYHTMRKSKSQGFVKSFSFLPMVLPQRICYTDSKRGAAAHFAARPGKEVLY